MAKPRKPIRRVSLKRQRQLRQYKFLRLRFLADNPACFVCTHEKVISQKDHPIRMACDIHHQKGRSGDMLNLVEWWLPVCRLCHNAIHNSPKWAYERGYLVLRSGKVAA